MLSFEKYVRRRVRARHPKRDGWKIESQKELSSGLRIDHVAYRGEQRAVYEAKDKGVLTSTDVEKVAKYRGEYKAQAATIYTSHRTGIPASVRKLAKKLNVRIRRTLYQRKRSKF